MRSTFYGLDIAARGLFVSQRQTDVMGHNVANANTEGYSRQRYITSNVPPPGIFGQFAPMSRGQVGHGVETLSLDQIRDIFLDRQYRQEVTKTSYWDSKAAALSYIENVFNGLPETRLDCIFADLFTAMQEVSMNPTDQAVRTTMVKNAEQLTTVMHEYYNQLTDLMYQQDFMLVTQTNIINQCSQQIAALNDSILRFEQGGQVANDLRDHRNLLLDKLAGLVDISYEEYGLGKYDINGRELTTLRVFIGADKELLVDRTNWMMLENDETTNDITAMTGANTEKVLHNIVFGEVFDHNGKPGNDDGFPPVGAELFLESGELKAYLDIRDGNAKEDQGIPYYISQLNALAFALVETFNEIHLEGYSMPYTDDTGVFHESESGKYFFEPSFRDAGGEFGIRLSDDILESVFNFAASSEYVYKGPSDSAAPEGGDYQTGNNRIALDLIKGVKERGDIDVIGSFEDFFKSFIADLSATVKQADTNFASSAIMTDSIHAQRLSIMSVSIDEEMTDMIRFQHAYNAAARSITAMDEMLDVMINRMGRVGL